MATTARYDAHRERGNRAIDCAARFLIIGYGFNDVHLETHLSQRIKSGVPTLIITHSLSPNAKELLKHAPHYLAIESADVAGVQATRVYSPGAIDVFAGISIWDLESLVKEVFEA